MTQDALAFGSKLLHRSIPASVAESGACLQTMGPEYIEGEIEDEMRSLGEEARAPEFGADCEPPVGSGEPRTEGADVNQADRRIGSHGHDGEADVLSAGTLPVRPRDVALESFQRRRRRRNEPRYFLGGKEREQRRGIAGARLAKEHASSDQFGQGNAPVGSSFL